MSIRHPKAILWEERLKVIFDRIDAYLEAKYGHLYPLHPSRPSRGGTSNPEQDGLFNVGSSFSPGYGSEHGPGYIVEFRLATLSEVPDKVRLQIEGEAVEMLNQALNETFPGQDLRAERDGPVVKIIGDLSLGDV
ncbi:MAG: hypothetical protein V2A34_11160 [Lentisphaerota bacterium]